MISKATISFIHSLKQKKQRQKYNKFILEGEKIILEGLNEDIISFDSIFCIEEKVDLFEDLYSNIIIVSGKELKKMSNMVSPPGILAIANIPDKKLIYEMTLGDVTLFLDDIKDPGNLGTIIRSADWFGVNNIIATPETVELYNPKVVQSSMGSFARVNYFIENMQAVRNHFKAASIIGTSLKGSNLYEFKPAFPIISVIGSESQGISKSVEKLADILLKIPKHPNSKSESLNAAIANANILSYFAQFQKDFN